MGGGGGGGRFSGTIGAGGVLYAAANRGTVTDVGGGFTSTNQQYGQSGRKVVSNDNAGNIYQGELGPYRGNQPAFHNAHPVIFDQESKAPHKGIGILAGALTPDKGLLGDIFFWFS